MERAAIIALALVFALPLVAHAQEAQTTACRAPALSLQPGPRPFDPGASTSLLFAIENPNGPPVEAVRATVTTTAPAGWSATPAQRELTLGPKNVSVDALAITAPNRGSGQASGNITLLVTFVCTNGDIQTSASTSTTLPVSIVSFQAPWPLVLTAFLVLVAGVGVLAVRRLRRGVGLLALTPERPIEPGKSAKFTFNVENRRGKPQRFRVAALGVPAGWSIHLALEELELEPGEEKTFWAILRAPATVVPGDGADVDIVLEAQSARDNIGTRVRARVVPPE